MTEITRVPLQPIARGSLAKMWLGVAAALIVAGGAVYAAAPEVQKLNGGGFVVTERAGKGPHPTATDIVLVNYVGKLKDGTEFDRGERVPMNLDQVVPGFAEGVTKMQKGGKARLMIPAAKAYGAEEKRNPQTGQVVIPANSDLAFDVELIDFKSREEVMRQQMMMQQLQQLQGAPGAPGAGAPPQTPPQ